MAARFRLPPRHLDKWGRAGRGGAHCQNPALDLRNNSPLSPAQWLPKPTTSQSPDKRRALRALWSPLSRGARGPERAVALVKSSPAFPASPTFNHTRFHPRRFFPLAIPAATAFSSLCNHTSYCVKSFKSAAPSRSPRELSLSLSMIYKWAEPPDVSVGSGTANPLDRIDALQKMHRRPAHRAMALPAQRRLLHQESQDPTHAHQEFLIPRHERNHPGIRGSPRSHRDRRGRQPDHAPRKPRIFAVAGRN